jgi:hypothetical protein
MRGDSMTTRKQPRPRAKIIKLPVPTEDREQAQVMAWARANEAICPGLEYLHCSLNGVRLTPGQVAKAKRQGLKPGVPDLSLPCASRGWAGLYIELKRRKGGTVSKDQKRWIEHLNRQGYLARVCKGSREAIDCVKMYLGMDC